ncbi:MAG: hypothetical protein AUK44_02295 [Porphyromonadaceae bacterium CG2_30_38_12]|nr:MAG: hypothetical protein AUK44_02295 [Porphyromonadaceae bacterium CG2_30_38_12]
MSKHTYKNNYHYGTNNWNFIGAYCRYSSRFIYFTYDYYVTLGKEILKGTDVKLATFFGFGMGHETLNAKIALMKECVEIGTDEVDYQPNMSAFVSRDYDFFAKEAQAMLDVSKSIVI